MAVNKEYSERVRKRMWSWGEEDTRPLIRVKENKERDEFDYRRKREWVDDEKEVVKETTGDRIENIHIWSSKGLNSQRGKIRERIMIKK